jgi:predicted nuclease with TOPRIM domain
MSHDDKGAGSPSLILDPHQLAAIERAKRRLEELRRKRSSSREALEALEAEYERARVRLDALTGGERTVPAYRHTTSPMPRKLVESLEETIRRAGAAREPGHSHRDGDH